jgi:phosphoribosylformylglycinamidine synthase
VVGVLGVLGDVRCRLPLAFSRPGARVVLLGTTGPEFGGSAWAWVTHGHLGGRPPAVDLAAERALAEVLAAAATGGLLTAAHDLSDGGLAVALAECCVAGRTGCQVSLPGDPFTALFSESAARAVAEVAPGAETAFAALCERHAVPLTELGTVGGGRLEVAGCFSVPVAELAEVRGRVLPALFG